MNWLFIVIMMFLALNIVSGYTKGFLRTIYYLVQWALVLAFVTWATPYVTDVLMKNTAIETAVQERCSEWLHNCVERQQMQTRQGDDQAAQIDQAEEGEKAALALLEQAKSGGQSINSQEALSALGIQLPKEVSEKLLNTDQLVGQLVDGDGLYETISQNLTDFVLKGIAYLIVLAVSGVIFRTIGQLLRVVDRIPVLNGINRMLGIAAGLIKGMVGVWVFLAVVAFFSSSEAGISLLKYIYEAPAVQWMYENNLVMNLILMFL